MAKNKTFQIRLTEDEFNFIKNSLKEKNISEMIRQYLLEQAKNNLSEDAKKELDLEQIKELLEEEEVLLYFYNKLKGIS